MVCGLQVIYAAACPCRVYFSVPPLALRYTRVGEEVLDARLDPSVWSAYPEAFVAPVSAASGRAVYSPQQDRFERFSLWKDFAGPHSAGGMLEATPEVPAQRLAAQIGKHESSLILFLNENSVPSILSKLPTDITVRQLAKRPKGSLRTKRMFPYCFKRLSDCFFS